ncbi:MAG TPA: SDR family oxidoreductase [Thermoanaerobaculia bacterium]|jgi:NAD(P)-dependent dehydrogenase (short-subunit alcohol dehydrogenase family)
MTLFDGRTALVTGGAKRVGLAIAQALEAEGARVLVTSRTASGENAIAADLSTREGVEALLAGLPPIDILVNSAANFIRARLGEVTWENFDDTFALNLRAPFFLSQTLGLRMQERGWGRIVSIADVAATIPFPAWLPYSISKAGIVALTRGLAKALAPQVLVNAVAPGPVLLPDEFDPADAAQAVTPTLLKRPGSAEEVARTVVFLAGSDYVTGVTVPVDGGRLLR